MSLYPGPSSQWQTVPEIWPKVHFFQMKGKVEDANGFGICYLGCPGICVRGPTRGSGDGNKVNGPSLGVESKEPVGFTVLPHSSMKT